MAYTPTRLQLAKAIALDQLFDLAVGHGDVVIKSSMFKDRFYIGFDDHIQFQGTRAECAQWLELYVFRNC